MFVSLRIGQECARVSDETSNARDRAKKSKDRRQTDRLVFRIGARSAQRQVAQSVSSGNTHLLARAGYVRGSQHKRRPIFALGAFRRRIREQRSSDLASMRLIDKDLLPAAFADQISGQRSARGADYS